MKNDNGDTKRYSKYINAQKNTTSNKNPIQRNIKNQKPRIQRNYLIRSFDKNSYLEKNGMSNKCFEIRDYNLDPIPKNQLKNNNTKQNLYTFRQLSKPNSVNCSPLREPKKIMNNKENIYNRDKENKFLTPSDSFYPRKERKLSLEKNKDKNNDKSFLNKSLSNQENINDNLYCINCYNREMALRNKKFKPTKKKCSSENFNFNHAFDQLRKIDSDYLNDKILSNQERQMNAYNNLDKCLKGKPNKKKELQYINEYTDNPTIGLNLQDEGYYRNKKRNDLVQGLVNDNLDLYNINKPRKAIRDYYNKVQYDIPLLESNFAPSKKYKIRYIDILKKQMEDAENKKKNERDERIKQEKDADDKYNKFLRKQEEADKKFRDRKKKILYDVIKNQEKEKNDKKYCEDDDEKRGNENKKKMIAKNNKDYLDFVNNQKMQDAKGLDKWVDANNKMNKKKNDDEIQEDENWKNFDIRYIDKCKNGLDLERCADCNASYPVDKLYKLPKYVDFTSSMNTIASSKNTHVE